jgi:hypothetical protein
VKEEEEEPTGRVEERAGGALMLDEEGVEAERRGPISERISACVREEGSDVSNCMNGTRSNKRGDQLLSASCSSSSSARRGEAETQLLTFFLTSTPIFSLNFINSPATLLE